VTSILQDQGQLESYLNTVFVVLINFLNKAPEQVRQIEFPGQQGVSCLQVMCSLVAKTFELSQVYEDEIMALQAVSLANAILENIQGVSSQVLPGILDLYLRQMQSVDTKDLEVMIIQGIMVALWYDACTTVQYLESRQATSHVVQQVLSKTGELKQDFEVKKFTIGITALLMAQTQMQLPEVVSQNTHSLM